MKSSSACDGHPLGLLARAQGSSLSRAGQRISGLTREWGGGVFPRPRGHPLLQLLKEIFWKKCMSVCVRAHACACACVAQACARARVWLQMWVWVWEWFRLWVRLWVWVWVWVKVWRSCGAYAGGARVWACLDPCCPSRQSRQALPYRPANLPEMSVLEEMDMAAAASSSA